MRLIIGTKFIWHDSSVFIYNCQSRGVFAMSEERATRFNGLSCNDKSKIRRKW